MKLSQELQPVLLELANLERSQGHGAEKEIPEQAEYDKAKEEHKRLLDASGSAQMAVDDHLAVVAGAHVDGVETERGGDRAAPGGDEYLGRPEFL